LIQRLILFCAVLSLGACATSNAGWTGSGAQPFDASLAECTATTQNIPDAGTRATALNQCMATKGWTPK
jgi:hypothetical protein